METPPPIADGELDHARLAIAQLAVRDDDELSVALRRAVEISGRTLGVAHVGVWLFTASGLGLALSAEFRLSPEARARPAELSLAGCPAYAAALRSSRILVADDALQDPRLAELREAYLAPFDVGALLDAAVFVGGRVCGIVCHEHAGEPRRWKEHERVFACAVADMLSALFEQASRLSIEKQLRAKEQELARARRREVLAQISAGVAHDFRNALQVIITSVSLAAREQHAPQRAALLAAALEEAERANRLTRQLTDLTRGRDVVRAPLDVVATVESLEPSLERMAADRKVRLGFALAAARGARVSAEQTLLERAVVNLVSNAIDASPEGGTIDIVTRVEHGRLAIEVADRGSGVAPEHRTRLFDPFFTTKELGGGSGLGLAVVALAAELFDGEVTMIPREGGGARFVIALPLCAPDPAAPELVAQG